MLGIARLKFPKFESGNELTRSFPNEYYKQRYHVIGLLFEAEIRRTGIDVKDRNALEKFMLRMVSIDNPTHLSEEGENYLNRYAEGGYQIIMDEIGVMDEYTAFMIKYNDLLDSSK
jgi:hypothetical protein